MEDNGMTYGKWALGCAALLGIETAVRAQNAYPYTIDTLPRQSNSGPVKFAKIKIMNSGIIESCAFGDFNGDKILDIVSGNHWFKGPDFAIKTQFRLLSTADRTTPDDMTVTLDINGDGYDEVISGGHNIGLFCYNNPGGKGGGWTRFAIDAERPPDGRVDTAIAAGLPHTLGWHSGGLVDVDGDGKKEELLSTGVRADAKLNVRWWKFADHAWVKHDLGVTCEQWGSGMGDLNGDGRDDIICPDAWLEAPLDRVAGKWIKHPQLANICNVAEEPEPKFKNPAGFTSGHATQIYAYDVNKDGMKDILLSSGHANGIFWYQQARTAQGEITFLERNIDKSWYQSHNLEFEDMDGDGDPDLISGKRWGGWGPNEKAANNVFWYALTPGAANPWTRHVVTFNEKIGMGNKGGVRDMDKDGDLDLVVTSGDAEGTCLFVSQLQRPVSIAWKASRITLSGPASEGGSGIIPFRYGGSGGEGIRNALGRMREARHEQ
jgi:hypothetical protein